MKPTQNDFLDLDTAVKRGIVKPLLTTVVGSILHGTNGPGSDEDVRTLFLYPTATVLSIGIDRPKDALRQPGRDLNAWELGHFLSLCTKGSPTTLEVLLAPPEVSTPEGDEIRALFPQMLSRRAVFAAFDGFARSEKKTFQSPDSDRTFKSMGHHLRVLYNGVELLRTGTMTVRIVDTPIGETVLKAKRGQLTEAEVIRLGEELRLELQAAEKVSCLPEEIDIRPINQYLLRVREKYFWTLNP